MSCLSDAAVCCSSGSARESLAGEVLKPGAPVSVLSPGNPDIVETGIQVADLKKQLREGAQKEIKDYCK